jgi:hypothetical protein
MVPEPPKVGTPPCPNFGCRLTQSSQPASGSSSGRPKQAKPISGPALLLDLLPVIIDPLLRRCPTWEPRDLRGRCVRHRHLDPERSIAKAVDPIMGDGGWLWFVIEGASGSTHVGRILSPLVRKLTNVNRSTALPDAPFRSATAMPPPKGRFTRSSLALILTGLLAACSARAEKPDRARNAAS